MKIYFEVKHYVNNFVLNVPELKSLDFAPPHPNTLNESNAKWFFPLNMHKLIEQMAIANLLGVAGTDIPIRDIKKLMMPFTVNKLHI